MCSTAVGNQSSAHGIARTVNRVLTVSSVRPGVPTRPAEGPWRKTPVGSCRIAQVALMRAAQQVRPGTLHQRVTQTCQDSVIIGARYVNEYAL
jgi:hypothetical protein